MEEKRKSGIDIIGDVTWGTHFCQFYRTKEDLLDILAPYFNAGLENNEFCLWVTSKPLVKKEAEKAMRKALPNFDRYFEKRQIEIIPHTDWYLKDDTFDFRRVLDAWIDKLNQALAKGYDGMRITGNTAWLEKRDWKSFTEYEAEINRVIGKYRIIAICSYTLDRCSAPDIIDVVSNHGFALIREKGAWKIIESSEHKRLENAVRSTIEQYRSFVQNFHGIAFYRHSDFRPIFLHGSLEEITGYTEEMFISGNVTWDRITHPEDMTRLSESFKKMSSIPQHSDVYEYRIIRKDGQVRWIQEYCQNLCDDCGKPIIVRGAIYDITKRKQTEEALKDSEEKYRDLFENSTDFVYTLDLKGTFTDVNRAAESLSGYTRAELIGMNFRDYTTKESRRKVFQAFRRLFITGAPLQDFPTEVIIKDGSKKYFETSAALISKGNKIRGFQGISRDVTERKRAEKALMESKEKYRRVIETANEAIVVAHEDMITLVNDKMAEITGYSREELESRPFLEFIYPDDQGMLSENYRRRLGGEAVQSVYPFRYFDKNGAVRWAELSASLFSWEGKPATLNMLSDITDRKKAEDALRNREAFNFALFEYNPAETIVVDREGKITMVNMAKKKSGSRLPSIGEVMYKDYAGKHEIDMFVEMMECIKINKVKKFPEMKYRDRFLSITISPFPAGAIIISEDITERKTAEEKIKSSLSEKEILLKEIHHRVKNNMQVIASLLSHQADRIENIDYKNMFIENINRIKTMIVIHELLHYSEDFSRINCEDHIKRICDNLISVYFVDTKKIEIKTNIKNVYLSVDNAIPLGIIINELVSNSLKHGFPDDRNGKITITMKKEKNKKVELKIRDNGVGIPETIDWKNPDSLGLHLVNILAEIQLEGKIELTRTKGTEFRITFQE